MSWWEKLTPEEQEWCRKIGGNNFVPPKNEIVKNMNMNMDWVVEETWCIPLVSPIRVVGVDKDGEIVYTSDSLTFTLG